VLRGRETRASELELFFLSVVCRLYGIWYCVGGVAGAPVTSAAATLGHLPAQPLWPICAELLTLLLVTDVTDTRVTTHLGPIGRESEQKVKMRTLAFRRLQKSRKR
jgi:hypothetical protein